MRISPRAAPTRPVIETVQLYVHERAASITQPLRRLIGVRQLRLAPGGSAQALFPITRADLRFIGPGLRPMAEPGVFDFWIAPSCTTGLVGRFVLLAPQPVDSRDPISSG